MWIADHHFEKPLSDSIASKRRERVGVASSSIGTPFQKDILHRTYKLVRYARAVILKHAKSLYEIVLAGELAEDFREKHSLRLRQIAFRDSDQPVLQHLVLSSAFGEESRKEVAVPIVGDEFSIKQFCVWIQKRQQYLGRPRTLERPSRFDP